MGSPLRAITFYPRKKFEKINFENLFSNFQNLKKDRDLRRSNAPIFDARKGAIALRWLYPPVLSRFFWLVLANFEKLFFKNFVQIVCKKTLFFTTFCTRKKPTKTSLTSAVS